MKKKIAVITVSDSCYQDPSKDTSGPTLKELVKHTFPDAEICTKIVPDEQKVIIKELMDYCHMNIDLILTTGGTGLSPRDVTPEATKAVIQREVPAISVALTIGSLNKTPMAMLSRMVAGICQNTLIINLPGSKKAVIECYEIIQPVLNHAIALICNETDNVKDTHTNMQSVKTHVCPHQNGDSKIDYNKVAYRPRESPYPMLEMSEAWMVVDKIVKEWSAKVVEETEIPIEDAVGMVVAAPLCAKEPMPPFPASIKDGYACISSDGVGVRRVRGAISAGEAAGAALKPGECARINTGAPLPQGADCVVQVEDTKLVSASGDGKEELEIEIMVAPKPNQDVRPIGFDIPQNTMIADIGDVLDAGQIGVLAGAGHQYVKVRKNPTVALLSTGNELQEPWEPNLRPSHIRDSNRTMLRVLLKEHGYSSVDMGIARDCPIALAASLRAALSAADVIVCSGGVSMGDRDLLKPVLLQEFKATMHFGRVRMKPGKPTTFATCHYGGRTKLIFALPGNPVSAYVCCLLFVVRALRACSGAKREWPRMLVRTNRDIVLDPRPEYARATIHFSDSSGPPTVTLIGNQCSSRLLSACGATVLVELPGATDDKLTISAGENLTALVTGRLDRSKIY